MPEPIICWHPPAPGRPVEAIGGHYTVEEEGRLTLGSGPAARDLVYWVASAEIDNACCGTAGCLYAIVPGFLARPGPGGPVPEGEGLHVVPVGDEDLRRRIREELQARHPGLTQVLFPNG